MSEEKTPKKNDLFNPACRLYIYIGRNPQKGVVTVGIPLESCQHVEVGGQKLVIVKMPVDTAQALAEKIKDAVEIMKTGDVIVKPPDGAKPN